MIILGAVSTNAVFRQRLLIVMVAVLLTNFPPSHEPLYLRNPPRINYSGLTTHFSQPFIETYSQFRSMKFKPSPKLLILSTFTFILLLGCNPVSQEDPELRSGGYPRC